MAPTAVFIPGEISLTTLPATAVIPSTLIPTPTFNIQPLPEITEQDPQIDGYLTGLAQQGEFSGAVIAAQADHLLLRKGYGYSDRDSQVPNAPQTRFDIGSLTKAFTAAAVLRLQADGKLDVQDAVCAFLEDCPPVWQGITLQQLLTHTSGIPDYANSALFSRIDDQDCTPAQIIPLFRDLPLDFAPGSQWRYSNSGYVLLGEVIEEVSGRPYAAYLKDTLLSPLGLQDTGLDRGANTGAVGYLDGEQQAGKMTPSSLYSAGGLYSTVDDLYRWFDGLEYGNVIPGELFEQMMSPQTQTGDSAGRSYGYGWFLDGTAPPAWEAHGGNLGGFSAEIIHRNSDDALVIVLSNQANVDAEGIGFKLLAMLQGD